ncbi:putative Lipoxygenase [Sesbania bispinosa]|nr:putative Lipoxygenase [Sesbania bispinosa]
MGVEKKTIKAYAYKAGQDEGSVKYEADSKYQMILGRLVQFWLRMSITKGCSLKPSSSMASHRVLFISIVPLRFALSSIAPPKGSSSPTRYTCA